VCSNGVPVKIRLREANSLNPHNLIRFVPA
jgi:hypothetical protein